MSLPVSASLSLFLLSMLKCPFSLSPLTSLPVSFLARKQHVKIISNELVSGLSLLGFMYDGSAACSGFDMHESRCNALGPGAHWLQHYFRCFCILIMNNNEEQCLWWASTQQNAVRITRGCAEMWSTPVSGLVMALYKWFRILCNGLCCIWIVQGFINRVSLCNWMCVGGKHNSVMTGQHVKLKSTLLLGSCRV